MKRKGWVWGCAAGICALSAAHADVTMTTVPGMVSDGNTWSIIAGAKGDLVALTTVQALVAQDTDTFLDGYLFNLGTGELELLVPEPASGSVTLSSGQSFYPRNFSADGNRLLLGGNSNFASAAQGTAAIVFDFATREYIPASVLPDGSQADRPNNELLSGNGQYVIFSNATSLGGSDWELTWYQRDLEAGTTKVALTHRDGGGINQNEGRAFAVSADGNKLLAYAVDGVLDAADTNGRTDYFVIDIAADTATRVDAVTADGSALESFTEVIPSPDFDYLLLVLNDEKVTSRVGDKLIADEYAVYEVASGETLGLTEFLGLPERYLLTWDEIANGSSRVEWGASSRYMVVAQGPMQLPGDANYDPKFYVIDRETHRGWIAGLDNEGNLHQSLVHEPRAGGGVLQYMAGQEGGEVQYLEHAPVMRDLAMTAGSSDGVLTITLGNDGENEIYNAGVSIAYSLGELDGLTDTSAFDTCKVFQIDLFERVECTVGVLPAGSSEDFVLNVDADVSMEIEAGILSGPDATPGNNTASVDVSKPTADDGSDGDEGGDTASPGGGGGLMAPWLLAALLSFRALGRSRQRP